MYDIERRCIEGGGSLDDRVSLVSVPWISKLYVLNNCNVSGKVRNIRTNVIK